MANFSMKHPLLQILLCLTCSLPSFAQPERKDFVVEVTFIDWLNQPFVKYTLNKKEVKVETSNYADFKIVKEVLYKRKISKLVSDSIYRYLSALKIDTAKANCDNPVLDGLYRTFYYEGYGLGQTLIKTHACLTTSAAKLQQLAEGQIKNKKYWYSGLKLSD